jgi:hypothetical protein
MKILSVSIATPLARANSSACVISAVPTPRPAARRVTDICNMRGAAIGVVVFVNRKVDEPQWVPSLVLRHEESRPATFECFRQNSAIARDHLCWDVMPRRSGAWPG